MYALRQEMRDRRNDDERGERDGERADYKGHDGASNLNGPGRDLSFLVARQ